MEWIRDLSCKYFLSSSTQTWHSHHEDDLFSSLLRGVWLWKIASSTRYFPFDMPPLYLYIIFPFTTIASKIAQRHKQPKRATIKHILQCGRRAEKGHGLMCGMIWPNARSRVKRASQSKRKHTLHTLSRRFISHFNCLIQIWQVVRIFWAQYNVDFPCCGNSVCCEWKWEK